MARESVTAFVDALREQGADENSLERISAATTVEDARRIAESEGIGPVLIGVALEQVPPDAEGEPTAPAESIAATREFRRVQRLTPEEAELERMQGVLRQYLEAGLDAQLVDGPDGDLIIVSVDPVTGESLEWDTEQFDEEPVARGRLSQDSFGRVVELEPPPPPAAPDQRSYLFGLTPDEYQVDVPVDQYMAMLRWLDPDTTTTLEDQEKIKELFGPGRVDETGRMFRSEFAVVSSVLPPGTRHLSDLAQEFGIETVPVGPKYVAGDEHRLFQNKTPEWVAWVQAQLVKANLLDPVDVLQEGAWGLAEAGVMRETVMQLADARGVSWQQALTALAENPIPDPPKPAFIAPTFSAPDTATLSQDVKRAFRARLGREPEPWEMEDLIRQMEVDHFADYQAQVQAARMEWDARNAAQTAVEQGQVVDELGGGTVQRVDPQARFMETFDRLYRPEEERIERVGEQRGSLIGLTRSLAGLSSLVENPGGLSL